MLGIKKRGALMDGKAARLVAGIELEKSKLNREKSTFVLDKALQLYFSFLFVGVIGFVTGYINSSTLNLLIMMGLGALIVGIVPYVITIHNEDIRLKRLSEEFSRSKRW